MKLSVVRQALAVAFIAIPLAAAQVKAVFVHQRDVYTPTTWQYNPHWENGLVVGVDANHTAGPIVFTIDRDGRRDEFLFTLEDSGRIDISSQAVSSKGEIALGGAAYSRDSRFSTFIARIDPARTHQTILRTWPLRPGAVTFSPDGTVWAIGNLTEGDNSSPRKHVLRRFDSNGKLLGSSTIAVKDFQSLEDVTYLRGGKDRVGWFTGPEYLEFGLDGVEISRYEFPLISRPEQATGFALSPEGDVVVSLQKGRVFQLDRQRNSWDEVVLSTANGAVRPLVLGFDGTTLVTSTAFGRIAYFSKQ